MGVRRPRAAGLGRLISSVAAASTFPFKIPATDQLDAATIRAPGDDRSLGSRFRKMSKRAWPATKTKTADRLA